MKEAGDEGASKYRPVSTYASIPSGRFDAERLATVDQLTSQGASESEQAFLFAGKTWIPPKGMHWKTTVEGLGNLAKLGRIVVEGNSLRFVRFMDDFPAFPLANIWSDVGGVQNRTDPREYREALAKFVAGQGIALEYSEEIAPARGMSEGGKITLLPGQSQAEEFATLAHEVAHLCGDEIYVALQSSRPFGGGVSAYDGHIISAN